MKRLIVALLLLTPTFVLAASNDLTLMVNDLQPYYYVQVKDASGAFNLSGYSVYFSMRKTTASSNKVDKKAMTVTAASTGFAEYRWAWGDTDTAGTYKLEIRVEETANTTNGFTLPTTQQDHIIVKSNFN
jgi:hypothetical protein